MSDELASTLTFIQDSHQDHHLVGISTDETVPHASQTAQVLPPRTSHGVPFHLSDHCETAPPPVAMVLPPIFTTTDDTRLAEQEARVKRLDLTWDDRDGIPTASLPAKFRMPDIDRYSGIGCPKIHLRLYNTVMRAHGIDDAQLVALFPIADIDVSRRELEATRQRPDESISSFVSRSRAKVVGMINRHKEQDQIYMVLRNLLPRFARRLVGIPFQDLKSLVHAAFSDTAPFPNSKGKKLVGLSSRSGEQPYIAQTSMQPRPPHPRVTTFPPPRPYTRRPARQFTPLGMTLTRAFEKLKDAGLIVPLAPRPLPHPIPPHFRSHEHCSFHQTQGHVTYYCSTLRNAIQDLIDTGLVNLSGPSVTVNPLPTHSTHALSSPPSL
ncbi:hypothetical protein AAG906_026741 [Vitis piasezkii]